MVKDGWVPWKIELPIVGTRPKNTASSSPAQFAKVELPNIVRPAGKRIFFNPMQPENVWEPMEVMLAGKLMLVNPLQLANAELPKEARPGGKLIDFNPVHREKVSSPMETILEGQTKSDNP